jgi:hypothetical protein
MAPGVPCQLDTFVSLSDVHLAIEALAVENPLAAQVIEMRCFGGMTAYESAGVVGRSVHVVQHELRFAQRAPLTLLRSAARKSTEPVRTSNEDSGTAVTHL